MMSGGKIRTEEFLDVCGKIKLGWIIPFPQLDVKMIEIRQKWLMGGNNAIEGVSADGDG